MHILSKKINPNLKPKAHLLIESLNPISVVKMKMKRVKSQSLVGRKVNTVFKTWRGTPSELRKLRKPTLRLDGGAECCTDWVKEQPKQQRYLVMGKKKEVSGDDDKEGLVATFILPWSRSRVRIYDAFNVYVAHF